MMIELKPQKGILSIIAREFDFSIDLLKEKKRAERTVYILQAGGMNLSYVFSWHLDGPDTNIHYDLREVLTNPKYNITKNKDKRDFSGDSWRQIREINEQFIKNKTLRDLELMTSMHYMYAIWRDKETPYQMKQWFRKKHADKTQFDASLITDEQLQDGLISACNLIAYKNYENKLDEK